MLLPEVCLIAKSSNDDPSYLHNDSNIVSDQVSSVRASDIVASGFLVCLNASIVAPIGGVTTEKRPHPYFYSYGG